MKIKYGDVPNFDLIHKLVSVSFSTPKKNLDVYKFCKFMMDKAEYVENERKKLIQKYGKQDNNDPSMFRVASGTQEMEQFLKEFNELLNMEVEEDIKSLLLTELDFETCVYSPEKKDWLNPKDIGAVLKFCE